MHAFIKNAVLPVMFGVGVVSSGMIIVLIPPP